jgi:GT2 family glycosyltransferase
MPAESPGQYPLVSVVTVNYGHSEVTCEMLSTLFNCSYPSLEVIVIDNCAPGDNPGIIKEQFPQINLVEAGENLGFAGANNLGIEISRGEYILLINNDTEVTAGFLEPLVDKMRSDPSIGAVSPKIRYFHNPDTIQYAGLTPINSYTVRSRSIGFAEVDTGQYETDSITAYAHGAAMLISRSAIRRIGLMSTAFFLYYEELDWGFRLRKAGYKIYYVHNSLIFHKESVSTGKMSPLKTYYLNRSRLLYMRRNVFGFRYIISILFQCLIAIPKNATHFVLQGRFDLARAYQRAIGWHVKNIFNKNIYGHPYLKQ